MRTHPSGQALELSLFLADEGIEAAASHVPGPPQVQLHHVIAGVGPDQIRAGEQFAGGLISGLAVTDEVDVGALGETAGQKRSGDAEQVGITGLNDALDDRQQVPASTSALDPARIPKDFDTTVFCR
ncbi:MAG: hypothetical protein ACRDQ4_22620 [Pseudonocardiaceae bacterium]